MILTQPHLVRSILDNLRLTNNSNPVPTPSLTSRILHADIDGEPFDNNFNYQSVIGKLNYRAKSTRADLEYAVHQCARFMANPKRSHGIAVQHIGRYLLGTRDQELILTPQPH